MLVSIGRRPNARVPGLDKTHVQVTDRGFIQTDLQRRTDEPTIFAIGDVAGEPMLAHKASHEARVAVEAIAGHKAVFEPQAIPAVVFTDPEIAWAGLTETQAEKEGRKVEVARFPWGASGRAIAIDRVDGMTKLLIDPQTERILGVGIVGVGRRRTDRGRRPGDRDGRDRVRREADDPPASDADRDGDGSGGAVLRHRHARL